MKKFIKIFAVGAMACALSFGTLAFSGCFTVKSYTGEYGYVSWGTSYGVKVQVEVQSDQKGERIRSVGIVESDYVEATDANQWEDRSKWNDGLSDLLLSYRGRYLADVLVTDVVCDDGGAPVSVANDGYVIAGATVGSGRLLLAVQNALKDAAEQMGYSVTEGEYRYENEWVPGQYYGIRVRVAVKDGRVMAVGVIHSSYIEATDNWVGKVAWERELPGLLETYKGKSVTDIAAVEVPCKENGEPVSVAGEEYVITGATVGSGRLLLAVQNALEKR